MPCPYHSLLYLIILIILSKEYKLWSILVCSFLQPLVTSSPLGPNILISSLFSNTLSTCSSLKLRDEVSHTYDAISKIIVLFIPIFSKWYINSISS
jgi:hypothetical protein